MIVSKSLSPYKGSRTWGRIKNIISSSTWAAGWRGDAHSRREENEKPESLVAATHFLTT